MGRLSAGSDKTEIRTFIHKPHRGDAGSLASPHLYQSFIAAAEYSGLLSSGRIR
jgi:hypothetical protein